MSSLKRIAYSHVDMPPDDELREIVLQLANSLRFDFYSVWRRCDAAWRDRMLRMSFALLRRELLFLLSRCGFRRLARLHTRLFRHSPVAVTIVGEYVTSLRMEHISVFSTLITDYRRMQRKYLFDTSYFLQKYIVTSHLIFQFSLCSYSRRRR